MVFSIQPKHILLCGIVFVVTFLWRFVSIRARSNKNIAEPAEAAGSWPFLGHLHLLGPNKLLHHLFGAMADKYGPIFSLRVGIHKTVVISSWKIAKECFTTQDKIFSTRPTTVPLKIMAYNQTIFGFLPYGPQWRELRKLVMIYLLSNHRLDTLKHVRQSEVNHFIRELHDLWVGKGDSSMAQVDLKERFRDLTLKIVVRMVAGKCHSGSGVHIDEESRRLRKAMDDFMHLNGLIMVSDAVPLLGWIDSLRGYKGKMRRTATEIDYVLSIWLMQHRQKRELVSVNELEQDFMHVMLSIMDGGQSAQTIDTDIKVTCLSLLLGGYDTTMVTLTWTVSLLLNNRHVLEKVQDELDSNVGIDRQVKESDVRNLTYLQAVVKETLRLYPAGPLLSPREALEDCTVAGFHIPAGTRLITNGWKLQRDPSIWSDPLQYRPKRFLEKHVDVDVWGQNFELIPFGSGRRSCPAITFSMQILHLTLAQLLHGFDVGTVADLPVDMTDSSGNSNPKATSLEVTLRPRLSPSLSTYRTKRLPSLPEAVMAAPP